MTDDLLERLRAETDGATVNPDGLEAAARIEELERHVELRDWFLVENGLWGKFAKGAQGKTDE